MEIKPKPIGDNYLAEIIGINYDYASDTFEWVDCYPASDDGITVTHFVTRTVDLSTAKLPKSEMREPRAGSQSGVSANYERCLSNLPGLQQMQVNIKKLIDDDKSYMSYVTVRKLRWPEGSRCPFCNSRRVIILSFDEKEPARQHYECKDCEKQFDDLTGTTFAGHHQPLKVCVRCLYLMGLNLPDEQMAKELGLDRREIHYMTSKLREWLARKKLTQEKVI